MNFASYAALLARITELGVSAVQAGSSVANALSDANKSGAVTQGHVDVARDSLTQVKDTVEDILRFVKDI